MELVTFLHQRTLTDFSESWLGTKLLLRHGIKPLIFSLLLYPIQSVHLVLFAICHRIQVESIIFAFVSFIAIQTIYFLFLFLFVLDLLCPKLFVKVRVDGLYTDICEQETDAKEHGHTVDNSFLFHIDNGRKIRNYFYHHKRLFFK